MSSSHGQPTRVQPPQPQAPPPAKGGTDLDLKTLIITAAASALAAFICSKVWTPGTLASAAFTPVVVALFREALRRPTEVVTSALPVPRRGTSNLAALPGDTPLASSDPTRVRRPGRPLAGPTEDPTRVADGAPRPARPMGTEGVTVYGVKRTMRHRWRLAALTGLLGFVIAAAVITVPELVAGKEQTTLFHSAPAKKAKKDAPTTTTTGTTTAPPARTTTTPTQTQSVPEATPTQPATPTEPAPETTPEATPPAERRVPSTPAEPSAPATPEPTPETPAPAP